MNWVESINSAISYMEDHLSEEITLNDIAETVHISAFHFQKAFTIIADMSPAEYLRKRRLSQAGIELSNGNCQVIDVALKYGYDSPESFSKAFSRFHGVTPMQVKNGKPIRIMNRYTLRISIEGGNILEYRIEKWDEFDLVLYIRRFEAESSEQEIRKLWKDYIEDESCVTVPSRIGACVQRKTDGIYAEYGIGCKASDIENVPTIFKQVHVPAYSWAVFTCVGPTESSLKDMWERIYLEWLPASDYDLLPDFYDCYIENLPKGDPTSDDYICEICIPVIYKR